MSFDLTKALTELKVSRDVLKEQLEDTVYRFRLKSVQPVVEEVCRKHNLRLSSGMGGYSFYHAGTDKEKAMFAEIKDCRSIALETVSTEAAKDLMEWFCASREEALKTIAAVVDGQALEEYLDQDDLIYQKCYEGAFLWDYPRKEK